MKNKLSLCLTAYCAGILLGLIIHSLHLHSIRSNIEHTLEESKMIQPIDLTDINPKYKGYTDYNGVTY